MRNHQKIMARLRATAASAMALWGVAGAAQAETWEFQAEYTVDVSGPVAGGRSRAGRVLDNLMVSVDRVAEGGLSLHGSALSNSGGSPNDLAETLQGVDNIEVARPRAKLYELWADLAVGQASLRAGLYDLNSEFYTTDSAGLLIAPAFGIGSELAATGPNGPSIFPSTALAARLQVKLSDIALVQVAAVNAKAGVVGDPGGVDLGFDDGALVIAEAVWTGQGKVALGAWRYTERQPGYVSSGRYSAGGAYVLVDQPIGAQDGVRATSTFARVGLSDGDTTPFHGGAQAGVLVKHVLAARPDSAMSLGVNVGHLASAYRRQLQRDGERAAKAEVGFELTVADKLTPHVGIQPSIQWVRNAGGVANAPEALIATLRTTIEY